MKARYSKVVISDDTNKKVERIRALKRELEQLKHNKNKFEEKRIEAKKFIDSISFKEMEVIGHILGNEIPKDYFEKDNKANENN